MTIHLTGEEEARCLDAIRRGAKSRVAVAAVTTLRPAVVDIAVRRLMAAGMVERPGANSRLR